MEASSFDKGGSAVGLNHHPEGLGLVQLLQQLQMLGCEGPCQGHLIRQRQGRQTLQAPIAQRAELQGATEIDVATTAGRRGGELHLLLTCILNKAILMEPGGRPASLPTSICRCCDGRWCTGDAARIGLFRVADGLARDRNMQPMPLPCIH